MEIVQGFFEYWMRSYTSIFGYIYDHIIISFTVIISGIVFSIPLAVYMTKMKSSKIKNGIFNIANILQTIPPIALLAIMVPLFGIGFTPAVVALFMYSLLPLLRNTYAGIKSIDQDIIDAAKGMGYSTLQSVFKIELPVALPYVMSGIRVSSVYIISWTALAALIGAGGLGDLILAGIGYNDQYMIFTGTIAAIVIAIILDLVLGGVEKKLYAKN